MTESSGTAVQRQQRGSRVRPTVGVYEGRFWMAGVWVCAVAIASVPLFSGQITTSAIPQYAAAIAVLMAGLSVVLRFPAIHPSVVAYMSLIGMWGLTVLPEDRVMYLSMVKVGVAALAAHILVRTRRHLLLVFGVYCAASLLTLVMNWADIVAVRQRLAVAGAWASEVRLRGVFGNENDAGLYGVMVSLCALIVFFNLRHRLRWVLLLGGLGSALIIGGLSGSRGAMLGLFLTGLGVPLMATAGRPGNLFLKTAKVTVAGAVCLCIVFAVLVQLPQFERFKRLEEGADADSSVRIRWELAKETVRVWEQHPLAGAGFSGFRRTSEWSGWATHTTYGLLLADGGLLGVMLFGVFLFLPTSQLLLLAMNHRDRNTQRLAAALLVFCVVIVVTGIYVELFANRDLIPMWAAMCGFIQHQRSAAAKGSRRISIAASRSRGPLVSMPVGSSAAWGNRSMHSRAERSADRLA